MKCYSNSPYQGIPNRVACNVYMVWINRSSTFDESCPEKIYESIQAKKFQYRS